MSNTLQLLSYMTLSTKEGIELKHIIEGENYEMLGLNGVDWYTLGICENTYIEYPDYFRNDGQGKLYLRFEYSKYDKNIQNIFTLLGWYYNESFGGFSGLFSMYSKLPHIRLCVNM